MSLCNDVAIAAFLKRELPRTVDYEKGVFLDLGCGKQPYRSIYNGLFKNIVTADFEIRSKITAQLDVAALPFRDNSFDVVLLSEVIEHVAEASIVLCEISRILRPGGYLFLTWPFMCPLHELPGDYSRYTEYGMEHLLQGSGLRIQNIERRGDVLCVLLAILEQFAFNGIEILVRIPFIGPKVFAPVKLLLTKSIRTGWWMYLTILGKGQRFRPNRIGASLKGPLNHFALWTLGYCAQARKVKTV